MNSISAIEVGPSCAREAVTDVDLFTIPEIVQHIFSFLEYTPIEEYHLSKLSRAFYSALAPRIEGPLKSIEDLIKEISELLPKVRGERVREILISSKETLTHLNETKESSLSKQAKLVGEIECLRSKLHEVDIYPNQEEEVRKFMKIPIMQRDYNTIEECKKWAESENFLIPLAIFKASPYGRDWLAHNFAQALAKRDNIEGALQVLPSIDKPCLRSLSIFSVCEAYVRKGRIQEILPLAKELAKAQQEVIERLPEPHRVPPEHSTLQDLINLLERAQCFDQVLEIEPLEPKASMRDYSLRLFASKWYKLNNPKAEEAAALIGDPKTTLTTSYFLGYNRTDCLFLLCKKYIRENQFPRAFALMQHYMETVPENSLKDELDSVQKVAALFVRRREFRKVGR